MGWIVKLLLLCVGGYVLFCLTLPPLLGRRQGEEPSPSTPPAPARGERVRLLSENADALRWRLRLIRVARQELILASFELRDDASGRQVMAALLEAADRGVQVRVLLDGIFGKLHLTRSAHFAALTRHPNVTVKHYAPVGPRTMWRFNFRLHEKYLIADDFAYIVGGRNTHDMYLREDARHIQSDRDVLVWLPQPGPDSSLTALKHYFAVNWRQRVCVTARPRRGAAAVPQTPPEPLPDRGDWLAKTLPAQGVTFLAGSAAVGRKAPGLWRSLCAWMRTAERRVVIQTPAVALDRAMRADLAALCRVVPSVQLVTNADANWINPLAAVYPPQRPALLRTGAQIFEYAAPQPFHTKVILLDDRYAAIGSFNLDNRSAYLDTEIMLIIDCPPLAAQLAGQVEQLCRCSTAYAPDGAAQTGPDCAAVRLSLPARTLHGLCRLLLTPFSYLI